jgi:short-subunit dehydrogenase
MKTEPLRREIVMVTGASSGIGVATARELARRGFHVLAGGRRSTDADALRATNLEPIMLEAVSDALRREVEPLGLKVIVIEPGAVATEMLGRVASTGERITSGMTTEQRGRYATLMHSIISQAQAASSKGVPAEEAGRVIADAITSKRPLTRYTVGRDAAIILLLVRCLSDRMLDGLLARNLKSYLPRAHSS